MYANGKWNDYTGQSVDVGFIGEFDKTPTATSTLAPSNTPNATQKPQATNRPQSTKKPQATKSLHHRTMTPITTGAVTMLQVMMSRLRK